MLVPANGSADDRTICAHIFADQNLDGLQQPDEPNLQGMTFRATETKDDSGFVRSAESNVMGDVCLGPLPGGEYLFELRSPTSRLIYLDPDITPKLVTARRSKVLSERLYAGGPVPDEVAFTGSDSQRTSLMAVSLGLIGFGLVLLVSGRPQRKRV